MDATRARIEDTSAAEPLNDPASTNLFDPSATARVMVLWIASPTAAAGLSYLFFVLAPSMA